MLLGERHAEGGVAGGEQLPGVGFPVDDCFGGGVGEDVEGFLGGSWEGAVWVEGNVVCAVGAGQGYGAMEHVPHRDRCVEVGGDHVWSHVGGNGDGGGAGSVVEVGRLVAVGLFSCSRDGSMCCSDGCSWYMLLMDASCNRDVNTESRNIHLERAAHQGYLHCRRPVEIEGSL